MARVFQQIANDFVEYGMHRTSVAPAIREAEALGFIRLTERGRGGNAEYGRPNLFFLTFAQSRDSGKHPPTHDWRRLKTLDEAEEAAQSARNNKDPRAVEHGKTSWHKRQQKQKADTESSRASIQSNRTDITVAPVLTSSLRKNLEIGALAVFLPRVLGRSGCCEQTLTYAVSSLGMRVRL